jgi:hypothetical protein
MENTITEIDPFFSAEKLPQKNLRVIVICKDFRCLGYLDSEGIWKSAYSNQPIENVLGWLPAE